MPKRFYTEEMKQFILDNYKGKTILELYELFNSKFNEKITYSALKSYMCAHKLRVGHKHNKKYKEEHIEFIRKNVKGITLKELTERFNKEFNLNATEDAISNLKTKYKLSSGIVGGQFQKGSIPHNKGKKMPRHVYEKASPTMFKKGNIPSNRKELYSERVEKDGYIYIKIKDGNKNRNWIPKQRYIYEKEHGKIPDNHKVIFADGDITNFDINNLILVSNAELLIMNRNNLYKSDRELTISGSVVAKLIDKVSRLKE